MQLVLVLAGLAAVFCFGWYLMGRLDRFLESSQKERELRAAPEDNTLRIGVSNPLVADSIGQALEQYSRQYPETLTRLFYGSEEELRRKLSHHMLDVIFLPEHVSVPDGTYYNVRKVMMHCAPVAMNYGGLPIEPIADGRAGQLVLWTAETKTSFIDRFIECLQCRAGKES